jgi:hypothetical protein
MFALDYLAREHDHARCRQNLEGVINSVGH